MMINNRETDDLKIPQNLADLSADQLQELIKQIHYAYHVTLPLVQIAASRLDLSEPYPTKKKAAAWSPKPTNPKPPRGVENA